MIVPEKFVRDDGLIDMRLIVDEGKEFDYLPGLLPNLYEIRKKDFPQLNKKGGAYLDSTATSQEPNSVSWKIHRYKIENVRGSNHSEHSTEAIECQDEYLKTKEKIKDFFGAHNYDVAFTSGTTASSNLVGTNFPFEKDDLLILTDMEHNSQVLTARNFADEAGVKVEYVPFIRPDGRLDMEALAEIAYKDNYKKILLNLVHASNFTGIINDVKTARKIIKGKGYNRGYIYLDCAQSSGHIPINLDKLDVDFVGVSAHKMYGPTGMGALLINKKSREVLGNRLSGGGTVYTIDRDLTIHNFSPERFEPGTPHLNGIPEWGFTIDYLNKIGMENIMNHDEVLGRYFLEELQKIKNVNIYGPQSFEDKVAVIPFNIGDWKQKNYDEMARELDKRGISVRDGCFCANIYVLKMAEHNTGINSDDEDNIKETREAFRRKEAKSIGCLRTSIAFYNTPMDIHRAVLAVKEIAESYEPKSNFKILVESMVGDLK